MSNRTKRTAVLPAVVLGAIVSASAKGDGSHLEKMRGYTEKMRNMAFSVVVTSSGSECNTVTHSFVRGEDETGIVFITVRCQGGRDYMIMESGIRGGSKTLTCEQVAIVQQSFGLPESCWLPL